MFLKLELFTQLILVESQKLELVVIQNLDRFMKIHKHIKNKGLQNNTNNSFA